MRAVDLIASQVLFARPPHQASASVLIHINRGRFAGPLRAPHARRLRASRSGHLTHTHRDLRTHTGMIRISQMPRIDTVISHDARLQCRLQCRWDPLDPGCVTTPARREEPCDPPHGTPSDCDIAGARHVPRPLSARHALLRRPSPVTGTFSDRRFTVCSQPHPTSPHPLALWPSSAGDAPAPPLSACIPRPAGRILLATAVRQQRHGVRRARPLHCLEGRQAVRQRWRLRHAGHLYHPAHRHGESAAAAGRHRFPGEFLRAR